VTLYEAMFARRSVRKFDGKPLDTKTLAGIQDVLNTADMMKGQEARFEIVRAGAVRGMKAPYYALAYCRADACAYANVGYALSKCDLFLQSRGLGSVFLGMAKPAKRSENFCVMLAFGNSGAPFRAGEGDFNRLPLAEISGEDNPVAHAVRVAPSAMNSQPWKLAFGDRLVTVGYFGRGLKRVLLKNKLNIVDVGIACRHAVVALQNDGKEILAVTPKEIDKDFKVEIAYR